MTEHVKAHPAMRSKRSPFLAALTGALLTFAAFGARPDVPSGSLGLESANGAAGVQFLQPDRCGLVRSVVVNRDDAEADVLVSVTTARADALEFSSRVWMPPMSRRAVWTPLLPPASDDRKPTIDVSTRLVFTGPGGERPSPTLTGPMSARAAGSRYDTAILGDPGDELPAALVGALRKSAGLSPANVQLSGDAAPVIPEAYEGLDVLFVSQPAAGMDARRKDAIRRWVARGGRVWVMLDRVPTAWAAEVFGDDWDVAVLDTVEVTKFEIDGPSGRTRQDLDYGVPLVRVLAPSFEATHRVNGYPAAMRRAVGRGELMVSLLGPRGWLSAGDLAPTPALQDLQSFVAPSGNEGSADLTPPEAMRPFADHLHREIGYRVLDRRWIVSILGGAAVLIIAAGAVLSRRSRLELVAAFGALGAVAGAATLAGVGSARQSQTPSTVAVGQLLGFDGRGRHAECTQRVSIYTSPQHAGHATDVTLSGGGMIYPRADKGANTPGAGSSRLVWTDPEHVEFVGPEARAGSVRDLVTRGDADAPDAPQALVVLGAGALSCELHDGGLKVDGDPILVTPTGCIALRGSGTHAFVADASDVLPPGDLSRGALLTANQASRQRVVEQLLQRPGVPGSASLLAWAAPLPTGLNVGRSAPTRGEALAIVPITVAAPKGGGGVWVPAPLMRMSPMRGSIGGRAVSAAYDAPSGRWLSNVHQPMLVVMRFALPDAVRSMTIDSATMLVDIHAPGRDYDAVSCDGGRVRIIGAGPGTPGQARFEMTGDRAPAADAAGVLLVGIDVKAGPDQTDGQGWTIRRMELSVTGRMP